MQGKRLAQWAPADVVGDIELALLGDPEELYLTVAVVLRTEPDRLPPKEAAAWADALARETQGRGFPPYFIYKFHCADGEHARIHLEGEAWTLLIREVVFGFDRDEAVQIARDWTGEKTMVAASPAYIPGAYLAALVEFVTGVPRAWQGYLMSHWCWPSEADDALALVRRYPPGGTDAPVLTPEEEAEGQMPDDAVALVPREVVDLAFQLLLESPRWDASPPGGDPA
ncbi:MAG: hypothetical protein ACLQBB_03260 [Solirubrobacteraceae bacterium]